MRTTGPLVKITLELESNMTWTVTRERAGGGEKMSGAKSLKEAIQFIEAHEHEWEIFLDDKPEPDNENL